MKESEKKSIKIAISAAGQDLESDIDMRFGRCPYFIIVEIEDKKIKDVKAIENTAAAQAGGAGITAAQTAANQDVEAVITANIGPRALDVFDQLGIKVCHAQEKVKDAVQQFIDGKLEEISTPTGPMHMGMGGNADQRTDKKSERIFFPLLDNNGEDSEISPHFGHAPFFGLYDTEAKQLTITENKLDHADPTKSPVDQIIEAVNPTTVFAQEIGGRAITLFQEKRIKLKTGSFKTVKEVIKNLDELKDLTEGCGH